MDIFLNQLIQFYSINVTLTSHSAPYCLTT